MKPRTCKHCDAVIPLDRGFHFDKDLNLVCDYCGGIICPTEEEKPTPIQHHRGGRHGNYGYGYGGMD